MDSSLLLGAYTRVKPQMEVVERLLDGVGKNIVSKPVSLRLICRPISTEPHSVRKCLSFLANPSTDTEMKLRQCVSGFQGGIPEPWGAAAAKEAARLVGFVGWNRN
jgi:hypothetical protein